MDVWIEEWDLLQVSTSSASARPPPPFSSLELDKCLVGSVKLGQVCFLSLSLWSLDYHQMRVGASLAELGVTIQPLFVMSSISLFPPPVLFPFI